MESDGGEEVVVAETDMTSPRWRKTKPKKKDGAAASDTLRKRKKKAKEGEEGAARGTKEPKNENDKQGTKENESDDKGADAVTKKEELGVSLNSKKKTSSSRDLASAPSGSKKNESEKQEERKRKEEGEDKKEEVEKQKKDEEDTPMDDGKKSDKGKEKEDDKEGTATTKKTREKKESSQSSPVVSHAHARRATVSSFSSDDSLSPVPTLRRSDKGALSDVVTTQEMMEATFEQDLKKIEYLWTRGASIDCHDETNGYTPLHWAVINNKARSITWLLNHDAKVNAKDSMGWTPLHYAAHSSKLEYTRALLEKGASPTIKNNKGKFPGDLAKTKIIIKLLKDAKDKEKGPRLSWLGFKMQSNENTSSAAALINKAVSNGKVGNTTPRKTGDSSKKLAAVKEEHVEESPEQKKKRDDLGEREKQVDEFHQQLNAKEKELYLKEQELTETEQRINSKEGWVAMREKELLKLEKRIDKQKQKLVNRERALVEAEEKHRVAAISAAVQVIKWEELKLGELLGSGGFADVYKAEWRGDYVAVKVIKNQRDDDTFRLQFQQESLFLSKLRHYHVVQLMGVCVTYPHMAIVMELMSKNTLAHLLKAVREGQARLTARQILQLALETAKGMNFLHMMDPPLIHRDLKPANILLDEHLRVKIGDVGFVQTRDEELREGAQENFAGTPAYMAPECLRQEAYDQKADVFSFGYVLWELLTLKKPWKGKKRMEIIALAGYNRDKLPFPSLPSLPDGVPPAILEILGRCWLDVPSDRPSFSRLITMLSSLIPT